MDLLTQYPVIQQEMNIVQDILHKSVRSRQPLIEEACRELVLSGGKRLRPLLVLLSGMIGKYDRSTITPLAAAVELLHTATLVHDDIIDDSKLRRGKETVQSKWGKDVAVFTGDYLLCKAFLIIPDKKTNDSFVSLTRAMKVLCEGEIDQYSHRYNTDSSIRQYLKRIASKTAILFSLSCYLGASQSECSRKLIFAAAKFGMNMGMAFQITDDILDFAGKSAQLGKPIHADLIQGTYTLPVIYSLQNDIYGARLKQLLEYDHISPQELDEIYKIIQEAGGLEYSRKLASKYIEKARSFLNLIPEGDSNQVMMELLDILLDRII